MEQYEKEILISILEKRFKENMQRHSDLDWSLVYEKLINSDITPLNEMEKSGGEPDVVMQDGSDFIFFDCSKETPMDRRNVCYDSEALESRKNFKPNDSAINMASNLGIELLSVDEYKYLQSLGDFDLKTSSWLKTPADIRSLGGAIFGDKRYNTTFIYHNGAESYYGVRGFRGKFKI